MADCRHGMVRKDTDSCGQRTVVLAVARAIWIPTYICNNIGDPWLLYFGIPAVGCTRLSERAAVDNAVVIISSLVAVCSTLG